MAAALIAPPSGRRVTLDGGRTVISFVAPSYLGLERHPCVAAAVARAAHRWGISTATPRALLRDPLTRALEQRLAAFAGQPAALIFASSRHAAHDVIPALARAGTVCVDRRAYPTSMDGVRAAERRGARIAVFDRGDLAALQRQIDRGPAPAVIVTDGVFSSGPAFAPLCAYARVAERCAAVVYMDDSHGFGILGRHVAAGPPFGAGGGGLLRYSGAPRARVIVAGTLTKALGVPVAFVAGDEALLRYLADTSPSLVHDSPPSIPNVAAAVAALAVHDVEGETRRRRVSGLVARFRAGIHAAGLELGSRSVFPIQTVVMRNGDQEEDTRRALLECGVWPLVLAGTPDHPGLVAVRFFVTALHTAADIDHTIDALARISAASAARRGQPGERKPQARCRARVPPPRAPRETTRGTSQTAAAGAN